MPDMMKTNANLQIDQLWKLIGNMPFIAISYRYGGSPVQEVLVKCEHYNLTGSVKDRLALYIIQQAKEQGKLHPGDLLVVASSVNISVSFAAIGRAIGHRVKVILEDAVRLEIRSLIKSFGAEILLVKNNKEATLAAESMCHYDNVFFTGPFEQFYKTEVHEKTTGREIGRSLLLEGIRPAAFVAGTGTGGTLAGTGKYLKTLYPGMGLHPLQVTETTHRIPGFSDRLVLAGGEAPDKIVQVYDGDAILMAQQLAKAFGLAVGASSGANLLGAIKIRLEAGGSRPVVTVFPDDNTRYINNDLFKEEPVQARYLTPAVELLDYRVLNKV